MFSLLPKPARLSGFICLVLFLPLCEVAQERLVEKVAHIHCQNPRVLWNESEVQCAHWKPEEKAPK